METIVCLAITLTVNLILAIVSPIIAYLLAKNQSQKENKSQTPNQETVISEFSIQQITQLGAIAAKYGAQGVPLTEGNPYLAAFFNMGVNISKNNEESS